MRKISDNVVLIQLLEKKFGKMIILKTQETPTPYIEGVYKNILFQIFYKKNEYLIFTVSDNGQWLLNEFDKVFKNETKHEHICTYELAINNSAVRNETKYVKEWNMLNPKARLNDLKQGNIYLNLATIHNLKENTNHKLNQALITNYFK